MSSARYTAPGLFSVRLQTTARLGLLALVYLIVARASLFLALAPENVASVWPPSGVALAALLLSRRRNWLAILGVLFITNGLAHFMGGNGQFVSLEFALAHTAEAALAGLVVTRLAGEKIKFTRLRDIFGLVIGATLCNGFTALLGAAVPTAEFGATFINAWSMWWMADALGILLVTPLIVTWAANPQLPWRKPFRQILEAVVVIVLLIGFAGLSFGAYDPANIIFRSYTVFPFLIWAALRFSPRGTVTVNAILAVVIIGSTIQRLGFFADPQQSLRENIFAAEFFISIAYLSSAVLATLLHERRYVETVLRASQERAATIINSMHDGFWITDTRGRLVDVNETYVQWIGYTREELLAKSISDLEVNDQPNQIAQRILQTMETGFQQFETQHRRKNSTLIDIEMNTTYLPAYGLFFAFLRDVTERKLAEKNMHDAEEKFSVERIRRERELEAIAAVSAVLRTAVTHDDMLPIIVDQTSSLLQTVGVAISLPDAQTGDSVMVHANGVWTHAIGSRTPAGKGVSHRVFTTGAPYLTNDLSKDPLFYDRELIGNIRGAACMPLIAQEQVIGWLYAGTLTTFSDDDIRILEAISDIAANAIRRASLHEQTERRLQRLDALQTIDRAINSTLDVRVTLDVLLNQVISQLGVDAVAVWLVEPHSYSQRCAAAKGFRNNAITRARWQLGSDPLGQLILEHQTLSLTNLWEYQNTFTRAISLIEDGFMSYHVMTLMAKGKLKGVLEVLHRRQYTPEPEWSDFLRSVAEQAAIAIDNAELVNQLRRSNDDLTLAYDNTLEGWARALDLREHETGNHTRRVTDLTLSLASQIGISDAELVHIRRGALLHDIGKMGIPDNILLKPGSLTPEEWEIMRTHPDLARELLLPIEHLRPAIEIPYCHHEKWDGTGYPRKLKGENIPQAARIFAIIDVWDAVTTARPYRTPWDHPHALEFLRSQAGTHFDPRIVTAFAKMIGDG